MLSRLNLMIVALAIVGAAAGVWLGGRLPVTSGLALPANLIPMAIGEVRSNLALIDTQGKARQLSEWDGRLVLLNFWATWCGPCRDEMPLLEATNQRYAERGLVVIGVAIDEDDAVREYLKDFPQRYPILLGGDTEPDASVIFGNTRSVLPYSVLIGRNGKLLAQHSGSFSQNTLVDWLTPHL